MNKDAWLLCWSWTLTGFYILYGKSEWMDKMSPLLPWAKLHWEIR
jgi:hypothetical protein